MFYQSDPNINAIGKCFEKLKFQNKFWNQHLQSVLIFDNKKV